MRSNRKISALLAMALFLSVALPVKAAEEPSTELTPPPELIILEGEEWLPNEPDPLIPTRGMDDDCRHNSGHPKNYRYIGAVKGSTQADTLAVDLFLNVITLGLPVILSDNITTSNISIFIMSALTPICTGSTTGFRLQPRMESRSGTNAMPHTLPKRTPVTHIRTDKP